MKYFFCIIDGVTDEPISTIGDYTPLETAFIPNLSYLSRYGNVGRVETVFNGFPIESMVCIMGLLGYDPALYYPSGRASFEALARGIAIGENDLAFRCNIVKVSEDGTILEDFTGGMISDTHGKQLLSQMKLPYNNWELYPGQSYRNLLILRDVGICASDICCYEPHMHQGELIENILPHSRQKRASLLTKKLSEFMLNTFLQIKSMRRSSDNVGNMLWLWSPSKKPNFPVFLEIHGVQGYVVAGLDFMHGLAMAGGLEFDIIPGATGYLDTDYCAKGQATINAFKKYDLVITHINATDEAGHLKNPNEKIMALESVDRLVISPVINYLRKNHTGDFNVVVCGDHMTRCSDGKHVGEPPVYMSYQDNEKRVINFREFNEKAGSDVEPISSLDLLRDKLFFK